MKKTITILFISFTVFLGFLGVALKVNPANYSLELGVKVLDKDTVLALDGNYMDFKLEMLKYHQPKVIAIGSSRAMQFRSLMFEEKFISAGYSTRSIVELEKVSWKVLNEIEYASITAALVVIDPEWLNNNYQKYPLHKKENKINSETFLKKIKRKAKQIISPPKKTIKYITNLSNPLYLAYFSKNFNNKFGKEIKGPFGSGFRNDGSYYYYAMIHGMRKNKDFNFKNTLLRIKEKGSRFESGTINHLALKKLYEIKQNFKNRQIDVIFMLPPYSPDVWERLEAEEESLSYLFSLKEQFELIDYDFSDPSSFGGDDNCEFIDGMHGSDVTYARMLHQIALKKENRDSFGVDLLKLERILRRYKGQNLILPLEGKRSYVVEGC